MTKERYQRFIVWGAVLYSYSIMLIVAAIFAATQTSTVRIQGTDIVLTPQFYTFFCFLSAITIPFQLTRFARNLRPFLRRLWYIVSGFPLFLYIFPVGLVSFLRSGNWIGFFLSIAIYFSFLVIAGATFRPKFE